MTHYADLSPCDYLPLDTQGNLLAVGWLDADYPYPKGDVDEQVLARLVELLVQPWQPAVAVGRHECQFCRFSGGPSTFQFNNTTIVMGVNNLFIPTSGFIYVAPSLILHYIDSHGYAPPTDFQRAVIGCPPMKSAQYLKAILANGGRSMLQTGSDDVPAGQKEGR